MLATRAEHHSNDLPWRNRCKVVYAEVDDEGRIEYDDIERLLAENGVDYVTITAASNVTGYITDVHRVAKMAHAHGAKIIVDGAQIVAHRKFSMTGDTPEEQIGAKGRLGKTRRTRHETHFAPTRPEGPKDVLYFEEIP